MKYKYKKDEITRAWLKKLLSSLFNDPSFAIIEKGLFLFNGLIYIPSEFRKEIVIKNHEDSIIKY
jgi:hypothetical protein